MITRLFALLLLLAGQPVFADGEGDNIPGKVRPIPPAGIDVPVAVRDELFDGVKKLGAAIEDFRGRAKPDQALLLPDVQIYFNAVRYALTYGEFYKENEFDVARELLGRGRERLEFLREGKAPWAAATGLVVRGYQSKVDGSIQPYGLVVPVSFQPNTGRQWRLDSWFHGRGETLTELSFINGRQRTAGQFTPPDTFVLHLYGRYSNGSKFAGETDLFEALAHVRSSYPIDENRLSVRGFSLGGASVWHLATHHAGLWAGAAPGAGFAETREFLRVFQNEPLDPPWYQRKLWHLYDATDYAINLFHCPTVAYSGEMDRQKQAADIMETALMKEGLKLTHLIGPKTAHRYHPEAKIEIDRRMDSIMGRGRDPIPSRVRFTTWTLRYNQMLWVTVDGLEQHWERARVDALIEDGQTIQVETENVSAISLSMGAGLCPLDATLAPRVVLDGRKLEAPRVETDRSWAASFRKVGRRWEVAPIAGGEEGLTKRHGLQGPIDDAFMDSFLMVQPTGEALNAVVGKWAGSELTRATNEWRRHFRGESRVKNDVDVTEEDIASHNLILWGDPRSNRLLERVAKELPIRWDAGGVHTGEAIFPAGNSVLAMIYPNPLNPQRYVVLNSGFTFREYAYLNNARQVPMLPDYAVIDVSVPATTQLPGGIMDAGFFGERWEMIGARAGKR